MAEIDLSEFVCLRCGACCCWPGDVKVTDEEIKRIAEFLEMNEFDFIEKYTKLAVTRRGLSLIEKGDGTCIFYDFVEGCLINDVKPVQCSSFPWRWTCDGWDERCAGALALKKQQGSSGKE